jgi:RND family efflux transporter MFP subunit
MVGAAALIVVVLVAVIGVVRFRARPAPAPAQTAETTPDASGTVKFLMEQQWAIRMKLAKAEPATVARQIVTPGRLVPAQGRHASVAPPRAGLIASGALPRVGQVVSRGETLALLRHVPSSAEQAQIETGRIEELRLASERRRAAQAIVEAEIRVAQARREFNRAQRLYEAKAVAQKQLEVAETDLKSAEAALATAIAHRDALREPPGAARTATPHQAVYPITAPIAGTVTRVAKSPGEQVAAGEAILELVALDVLWVEVPVFEADLPRLARPARGAFIVTSMPGTELAGRLVNHGTIVDPRTRAATLVFEVANPDRRLPVGLALEARLDAGERVQAVMVPREAVLELEGKQFVYVLRSGEEFERREVAAGDEHGPRIAVLSGLKPGERVVTQGSWQLRQHELRPASPGAHTHE